MLGPVARLQQRTVDWSLPQQQGVAAGKGLGARQGLQVCDWAVRGLLRACVRARGTARVGWDHPGAVYSNCNL